MAIVITVHWVEQTFSSIKQALILYISLDSWILASYCEKLYIPMTSVTIKLHHRKNKGFRSVFRKNNTNNIIFKSKELGRTEEWMGPCVMGSSGSGLCSLLRLAVNPWSLLKPTTCPTYYNVLCLTSTSALIHPYFTPKGKEILWQNVNNSKNTLLTTFYSLQIISLFEKNFNSS